MADGLNMTMDRHLDLLRGAQIRAAQEKEIAEKSKTVKNFSAIDRAAQEFEASFLSEMMRPMFEGIKPDPMFGGGKGEEIFQGMMIDEYGKKMAGSGGIGLAAYVRAELLKIQEGASHDVAR